MHYLTKSANDRSESWGHASALFSFLLHDRVHRSIRDHERRDLECLLVVFILGICGLLYLVPAQANVFLNLFFLPVAVSAFYLGRYRAGMLAFLSVVCASSVLGMGWSSSTTVLEFASWCGALTLTALFLGTLSDEIKNRFNKAFAAHVSETRTDALTHVANRRSFDIELGRQINDMRQHGIPFCLVLVDIDFFKRFNDTYGHQAGDKVLHDVARSLESTIRNSDVVFRYGGEEFAVLMPNFKIQDGLNVSERVRRDVEATRYFHQRVKLRLTVSVGVTESHPDDDSESIIRRADEALYTSKQAGRNCVHYDLGDGCEHFGAPLPVVASNAEVEDATPGSHHQDEITGLSSRQVFIGELYRRLSESYRYGSSFSLVMIRLQDFDEIEQMGESVANRTLSVVSELIRGVMRDTDLIGRYARETFAILMPSTTIDQAIIPVSRLLEEIEACETIRYRGMRIHLSAGAGLVEPTGEDAPTLLQRATDQIDSEGLVFAPRVGESVNPEFLRSAERQL